MPSLFSSVASRSRSINMLILLIQLCTYSNTHNTHITPNYLTTHLSFILYRVFLLLTSVVCIVSVYLFIWLYLPCTWLFLLHISLSFLLQTVAFIVHVFIYSALQLQVWLLNSVFSVHGTPAEVVQPVQVAVGYDDHDHVGGLELGHRVGSRQFGVWHGAWTEVIWAERRFSLVCYVLGPQLSVRVVDHAHVKVRHCCRLILSATNNGHKPCIN